MMSNVHFIKSSQHSSPPWIFPVQSEISMRFNKQVVTTYCILSKSTEKFLRKWTPKFLTSHYIATLNEGQVIQTNMKMYSLVVSAIIPSLIEIDL